MKQLPELHFEKVILIKEGRMLSMGNPRDVLTKETVREAFDVGVEIKRADQGRTYIRYEDSF